MRILQVCTEITKINHNYKILYWLHRILDTWNSSEVLRYPKKKLTSLRSWDCVSNELIWFQDKPVLEQRWPEVDMDYELEFVVKINGQESFAVKMPRHQLDQLKKEDAMNLAQNHETFIKYHSKKNILKTSFELYHGIQATLSLEAESKKKSL